MVVVVVWFWFWLWQGSPIRPGTIYVDQVGFALKRSACLILLSVGIKAWVTMPGFIKFVITLIN